MTHVQNKLALQNLTHEQRVEALKKAGWPDDQINDYVHWLFQSPESEAVQKRDELKQAEKEAQWQSVLQRALDMAKKAAEAPKEIKESLTPFERDVLHNRYMLNGSTDLDFASFHNPKLNNEKQVVSWIQNEFIPSGARMGLLTGSTGSGKTWGWMAYVNTIANPEFDILGKHIMYTDAMYVKAYRIAEAVGTAGKDDSKKFLNLIRQKRILILDELGGEPAGFKGDDFLRFFDDLMDERYKYHRLHTLITSNYTVEDTIVNNNTIPGVKTRYGQRFISRFNQIGHLLETTDGDMRQ